MHPPGSSRCKRDINPLKRIFSNQKMAQRTFSRALEETEYHQLRSDFNILVTHQAFDQASVGRLALSLGLGVRIRLPEKPFP